MSGALSVYGAYAVADFLIRHVVGYFEIGERLVPKAGVVEGARGLKRVLELILRPRMIDDSAQGIGQDRNERLTS